MLPALTPVTSDPSAGVCSPVRTTLLMGASLLCMLLATSTVAGERPVNSVSSRVIKAKGRVGRSPLAWPPALPLWSGRPAGSFTLPFDYPDLLIGQLDDQPGGEIVATSNRGADAGKDFAVFSWRENRITKVVQYQLPLGWQAPALGDLDGDGKDAIYVVGRDGSVGTLELTNDALRVIDATRMTNSAIGNLVVSDVRLAGAPELVLAVSSQQRYDSRDETFCDQLLGYAWKDGKWVRTWQQRIQQRGATLSLRSGDFLPDPGNELLVYHGPSDVSNSEMEIWGWRDGKLKRLSIMRSSAETSVGLQKWTGVTARLGKTVARIPSHTTYLRSSAAGERVVDRGELLEWQSGRFKSVYRLPGRPVAVGSVRGEAEGLIIHKSGSNYQLLEAAQ